VPSVDVLGRTTVDFELSRVYLTRYLMALDKQESDWAETNLRASMARVDKDLQDYKPLISDRMDGVLYEKAVKLWAAFKVDLLRVHDVGASGDRKGAILLYRGEFIHNAFALQAALDASSRYNVEIIPLFQDKHAGSEGGKLALPDFRHHRSGAGLADPVAVLAAGHQAAGQAAQGDAHHGFGAARYRGARRGSAG
jgi:hypothetical protein